MSEMENPLLDRTPSICRSSGDHQAVVCIDTSCSKEQIFGPAAPRFNGRLHRPRFCWRARLGLEVRSLHVRETRTRARPAGPLFWVSTSPNALATLKPTGARRQGKSNVESVLHILCHSCSIYSRTGTAPSLVWCLRNRTMGPPSFIPPSIPSSGPEILFVAGAQSSACGKLAGGNDTVHRSCFSFFLFLGKNELTIWKFE